MPSVEAMVEEGSAVLADPEPEAVAEAILALLRDPERRREVAARGLSAIQKQPEDWDGVCERFERILQTAVVRE